MARAQRGGKEYRGQGRGRGQGAVARVSRRAVLGLAGALPALAVACAGGPNRARPAGAVHQEGWRSPWPRPARASP